MSGKRTGITKLSLFIMWHIFGFSSAVGSLPRGCSLLAGLFFPDSFRPNEKNWAAGGVLLRSFSGRLGRRPLHNPIKKQVENSTCFLHFSFYALFFRSSKRFLRSSTQAIKALWSILPMARRCISAASGSFFAILLMVFLGLRKGRPQTSE